MKTLNHLWLTVAVILLSMLSAGVASATPRDSILYVDGGGQIFRINPDGTESMQLVGALTGVTRLLPARDGWKVLNYNGTLVSSNSDGTSPTTVSPATYTGLTNGYAFSPDGTRVAFTARIAPATLYSIYTMNADGTGDALLLAAGGNSLYTFDWGAQGILYKDIDPVTLNGVVWRIDPVTLAKTQIGPGNFLVADARYSPDGSKILMVGNIAGQLGYKLYIMNHDGSGFAALTTTPALTPNSAAWSSDGLRYVVSAKLAGSTDATYRIYNVDAATGAATAVAASTTTGQTKFVYWGLLEDPTTPTSLTASAVSAVYGGTANLQATLLSGAAPVAGRTVSFTVNGVAVGTATTDAAGVAVLGYPVTQPAGSYSIAAAFDGDAEYATSNATNTLTVSQNPGTLVWGGDTVSNGGPFVLKATLVASGGTLTNAGSLQFTIVQGVTTVGTYLVPVDSAGVATQTLPSLAAGNYTISVTLPANNYYTAAPHHQNVLGATNLNVTNITANYGDNVNLTATLTMGGAPVATRPISFTVAGVAAGAANTDASGNVSVPYAVALTSGTYGIVGNFAGDATYAASTGAGTLTVNPRPATLTYTGDTVANGGPFSMKVHVASTAGNITLAGPVTFTLTQGATTVGTYTSAVDASGNAQVDLPALASANYTLTVSQSNGYYASPIVTVNVLAGTQMVVANVPGVYGGSVNLSATLTMGGAPVVGRTVAFTVGSVNLSGVTDAAGVATVAYNPITQGAGPVTVSAGFAGDATYGPSNATGTLTVTQAPGTLTYNGDTVATGANFVLRGNLAVTQGTVTNAGSLQWQVKQGATVYGTYTAPVNASGDAVYTITNLPAASYTITLSLPANPYYTAAPVDTTVQAATSLAVANVSTTYGATASLTATLTSGGTGVGSKPIDFTVSAAPVGSATTNAGGIAALAYLVNQGAGTYPIGGSFAGDAQYFGSAGSGTLTVTQAPGTLTYTGDTVATGGAFILRGHLAVTQGNVLNAGSLDFVLTQGATTYGAFSAPVDGTGTAQVNLPTLPVGVYTVTVSLPPNSYYTAPAATGTIKAKTDMSVLNLTAYYADTVTLQATLTAGGTGVGGKTVALTVNAVAAGSPTTDAAGVASASYSVTQGAGTYPIGASFAGDASYSASSNTGTLTVSQRPATLTYTGDTVANGSAFSLKATVASTAGNLTLAGPVTFTLTQGATTVGTYTAAVDAAGNAATSIASLASGNYTLSVSIGGAYYTATPLTVNVLAGTQMTVQAISTTYGAAVNLQATLTMAGSPVVGRTVTFDVSGVSGGSGVTDAAGVATSAYTVGQGAGSYTITGAFAGDATYGASSSTATLTVTQAPGTLTYTGDTVATGGAFNLAGHLAVTQGSVTMAGNLEWVVKTPGGTVAGTYTGAVDAAGNATASIASLPAGAYVITLSLPANNYYTATAVTYNVKGATSIAVPNVTATYGSTPVITATLTSGATALNGKTLAFSVNGVAAGSGATNASGVASINYPVSLGAGTYAIDVAFAGDASYAPSSGAGSLTVNPAPGTLTYTGDTVATGGAFNLAGHLAVTQGAVTNAGSLQWVVTQGATTVGTYTGTVDAAGNATAAIPSLTAGQYTVTLSLPANGFYTASPVTVNIKAGTVLAVPAVSGNYADTVNLTATLTSDATGVSGKTITFTVGAWTGTGTTDAAGTATVAYTITQGAGTYTVGASFAGDANYGPSSGSGNLNVSPRPATLFYNGDTVANGNAFNLAATVSSTGGTISLAGPVTFTVTQGATTFGTYTGTVNAAGNATAAIASLPSNNYTVTVSISSPYYTATPATANILAGTQMSVAAASGTYGSTVTLQATLTMAGSPVVGRTVSFTVGGVNAGSATTDAAGLATVSYVIGQGAGTYAIIATFAGDATYGASNGSANLTVTQAPGTLTYTGDMIATGAPFVLKGHLDVTQGTVTNAGSLQWVIKQGATVIGTYTAPVDAAGDATYTVSGLAVGSYTVELSLPANNYYTAAMVSTIIRGGTTLTVQNLTVTYGSTAAVSATLTSGATNVSGRTIAFQVNSVAAGTGTTNVSGSAGVSYPVNLGAGTYPINADFAGDASYGPSSGSGTLTVTQAPGTLTYTGDTISTGGAFTLSGKLAVTQGTVTNAGSLQWVITQGATTVGTFTGTVDALGNASAPAGNLPVGNYTVTLSLPANPYYTASPVTANILAGTVLTVPNVSGNYADIVNLTATLTSGGNPVPGKAVTFTVGAWTGTGTTDAAGTATVPFTVTQSQGTYAIGASFAGDATYGLSSGSASLNVSQRPATIVYNGDTVANGSAFNLKATVSSTGGNITLAGPVTFTVTQGATVYGTYTSAVDAAGNASVTIASLPSNNYTVTTSISSTYYTATPDADNIQAGTQLTVAAVSGTYGSTVTLQATLTMAGAPVVGRTVTFDVAGVLGGSGVTDAAGVATSSYAIGQGAGSYTITASFAGDATYGASSNTGTLTVTQAPGTLSYTGDMVATGGAFVLKGHLAVTQGTVANAGSMQWVVMQGAATIGTYTAAVDAAGDATYTIPALTAGAYQITLSLPANNYYTAAPVTANIKGATVLTVPNVNTTYGATATITATITTNGVGVSGKTLSFVVNGGAPVTATTNAGGVATISYPVTVGAGTYPIDVTFAGDATHDASTGSGSLIVTQATGTLTYTGETVASGGAFSLGASLSVTQGTVSNAGSVQWVVTQGATTIGTYTAAVNGAGAATHTIPNLPAGTYTVVTSLVPNNYYTSNSPSTTILAGTSISVPDVNGQYADTVTISATLTSGGAGVGGKTLSFVVNGGAAVTATTNAGGVASITYAVTQPAGTYPINVSFTSDATHAGSTGAGNLIVARRPATITYTGSTIANGGAFTLSANVTSTAGDITLAGPVTFTVVQGATTYGTYTATVNAAGVASTSIASLPSNNYTVTTSIASGYYTATPDLDNIQAATQMTVPNVNATYGQTVNLTATLMMAGSPVAGRTVTFTVGAWTGTATTDAAGTATAAYTVTQGAGTYTITGTFAGDATYAAATATGTLTVTQAPGTLTYTGDTVANGAPFVLKAHLAVTQGTVTNAGSLQWSVAPAGGGAATVYTAAVDAAGDATYTINPGLAPGPYIITLSLPANNYYTASSVTQNVQGATVLTVPNVNTTYGATEIITATLTSNGAGVSGKTLSFKVNNGAAVTATTDASGIASIPYPVTMGAGTYPIDVTWAGDSLYAPSTGSGSLIVTQAPGTLAYTGPTVAYGGAFALSGTLTVTQGTVTNAGSIQWVVQQGATVIGTYSAAVNGSGVATYAIPNLPAGTYTVTTSLLPNSFYTASPVTTTILAGTSLSVPDVSGMYADTVTISATLTSGGAGVSGKSISFTVNGVAAGTATTNAAGVASISYPITQGAGTYPINATFTADATHAGSTGAGNLNVSKRPATITYTGGTIANGSPFTLSANIVSTAGNITLAGPFNFKVDQGATPYNNYSAAVDAAGNGSTSTTLPSNYYTVTTSINSNYYVAAPVVTDVQARTQITVAPVTATYGANATLTATLTMAGTGVSGKTVTFTVGAWTATATTDASGVATVIYPVTDPAGTYTITADFAGDTQYAPVSNTATLTVNKAPGTLTYTGDTLTNNGAFLLKAHLAVTQGTVTNAGTTQFTVTPVGGGAAQVYTAAVDAAGNAAYTIPNLTSGGYTITVDLLPNGYYTASPVTANVKGATAMTTVGGSAVYSDPFTLSATLTSGGVGVSGKTITFTVGSYTGTATTNASGVASINWPVSIGAGTYTITASFAGDANFVASSATNTLTVAHESANLAFTGPATTTGAAMTLTAKLTEVADPNPGNLTLAGTVQFTLTNVLTSAVSGPYSGTVNAAGDVSAATPALANAPYDVSVVLLPNSYYTVVSTTNGRIKGTPTITGVNVTGQYSDSVTLQATLTNPTGNMAGVPITFYINGVSVGTANTNASGVAQLPYTITVPAQTATITATYAGDALWTTVSATNTLTVNAESATITYTGQIYMKPSNVTISAHVDQQADGAPGNLTLASVQISGGAINRTIALNAAGDASYTYAVAPADGVYNLTTSLIGNGYFTATSVATTVYIDGVAPSVPGAPTAAIAGCMRATVTWPASADATSGVSHYTVYKSLNAGAWVQVATNVAGTSWSDTNLPTVTNVRYAVTATDRSGNTSAMSAASNTLNQGHCATITNVFFWNNYDNAGMQFNVSAVNTYVNVHYVLKTPGGALVAEWWQYGTQASDTTNMYATTGNKILFLVINATSSGAIPPGNYTLTAEVWYGGSPTNMIMNPTTDVRNITL